MRQAELDYETPYEREGGVVPFNAHVATVEEKVRLSKQCRAMLALLRHHDPTNAELAQIALKYTNRISELRQAGHKIPRPTKIEGGLWRYHLEEGLT